MDRITTIDIRVDGSAIIWSLSDWRAGPESKEPLQMSLGPRRKENIALLAGLLHDSTDVEQKATDLEKTVDREGAALYEKLLNVLGHELFDLLFIGDLRAAVGDALNDLIDDEIKRFRIKLCFTGSDAEWLARLPWEYARTPPGDKAFNPKGVFLSHIAELVLSRRLERAHFRGLRIKEWPVKVLLVCSSPPEAGEDELERVEAVRVVETLEELASRNLVRLEKLIEPEPPAPRGDEYRPRVTWREFSRAVARFQPVIVHFIGHGHCSDGAGELAFADEISGEPDWVTDDEFARVADTSKPLRLVFLQACKSSLPDPYVSFSGVARTLAASGIPAVIGMQYRVTSSAANAFAAAFYDALLNRALPISFAVQAARQELAAERGADRRAHGLPVLYLAQDAVLRPPPAAESPGPDGPTTVDRRDDPRTAIRCPRCDVELEGLEQNVCQRCGLRLRCAEEDCGRRLVDPVNDRFCRNCTAEVRQVPFSPDAVDQVATVAHGGATPARAALAVLRGPGGG
jgi:hypothetical protein